jgi:1-phosphofructokinase
MNIITVTLNPAIDETVVLESLRPGHVHRAHGVSFHAGGKGVNVASCLADWVSGPVTATGILGTGNAGVFEALFAAKKIRDGFVRVAGEARTNIKLIHDGDTTDINLPGLAVDAAAIGKVRDVIFAAAVAGDVVLLAGSLPAGVSERVYAELIAALSARGVLAVLDTSGAPLNAALQARDLPYCIKPNRAELEFFAGRALSANADLIAVARDLNARGIALVAVSLGAEGSVFVTGSQVLHARLPVIRAASTVGAGDAMVAGIIAALAEDAKLERIARLSTAFAVGKLGQAGPNLPARRLINEMTEQVMITVLEEGPRNE